MIAIVKYNAGNIRSVINALDRLRVKNILTDDPNLLQKADKIIFPGVGEARSAMEYLKKRNLHEVIISLTQPFLGICLGMQLMCSFSEENDTECLGIFNEKVKKFPNKGIIPHIGWNNFTQVKSKLFENISIGQNMYFLHSYYVEMSANTMAKTNYLVSFASGLEKDNFFGVQFHPEKSAEIGERLLTNFIKL